MLSFRAAAEKLSASATRTKTARLVKRSIVPY
jgi:hypothetical protein